MVKVVDPPALGRPIGYAHGVLAGKTLYVSGQIGATGSEEGTLTLVSEEFAPQFEKALANVLEVVHHAGGGPESVAEMTVFVTDVEAYRASRSALGPVWKRLMGKHYPAMTLVGVAELVERGARVEIRAVAYLE